MTRRFPVLLATVFASACAASGPRLRHLNPAGLAKPTGYTHVVEASSGRTLYVAGQVALDEAGNLVGKGDFQAQTRQVFENRSQGEVRRAGTSPAHTARPEHVRGRRGGPCGRPDQCPDFLIEIEATAVVE